MAPISRAAFARRLRRLDADAFAAFVAALWRARGRDATVEDGPVIVVDGGDRRLFVHHRRRWLGGAPSVPEDRAVDAVVTNARRPPDLDRPVVDADDLREIALYAVDRETADALFERYFDRPVSTPGDADRRGDDELSMPASGRAAVGVLGALVLGVGILLGVAGVAPSPGGAETTVTPAGTPDPARFETATATPTPASGNGSFPPGLGPAGITDADALASAHVGALANRSYRLRLTHREFVDGEPTAARAMTVAVDGGSATVTDRWRVGELVATSPLRVAVPDDPRDRFDGPRGGATDPVSPDGRAIRAAPAAAISWYLSVATADVKGAFERNGTTFYWVIASGDPWPGVENATTSALVDSRGIVHDLRREHDVAGTNVTVVFTLGYDGVDGPAITSATAADVPADERGTDAPTGNAST